MTRPELSPERLRTVAKSLAAIHIASARLLDAVDADPDALRLAVRRYAHTISAARGIAVRQLNIALPADGLDIYAEAQADYRLEVSR